MAAFLRKVCAPNLREGIRTFRQPRADRLLLGGSNAPEDRLEGCAGGSRRAICLSSLARCPHGGYQWRSKQNQYDGIDSDVEPHRQTGRVGGFDEWPDDDPEKKRSCQREVISANRKSPHEEQRRAPSLLKRSGYLPIAGPDRRRYRRCTRIRGGPRKCRKSEVTAELTITRTTVGKVNVPC